VFSLHDDDGRVVFLRDDCLDHPVGEVI
jgi:hypothetical protein